MLSSREKDSLVILLFLLIGWPIGLDRFYEGDSIGGFTIIFWWFLFFPALSLWIFKFDLVGLYLCLGILGIYGFGRLARKMILVARTFVKDEN